MKTKKYILIAFLLLIGRYGFAQQDPLYGQYQFNQSMINPAYAGVNNVLNATVIMRRQWVGIQGSPVTNILNVSTSMLNNKLGTGILVMQDKYGVNKNTETQAQIAYSIDLLNGRSISFGMQAGYTSFVYDYSDVLQEQMDPSLTVADGTVSKFNVGSGIFFKTKQLYFGVSVPKMINTETTTNGTATSLYQRHFYISAGYVFDQLISVKIKPSVLVKAVKGQPLSIDLNASVLVLETLWVGASIRNFNAAGLNSQFEINDMFRIGYSFEFPLNQLNETGFGTHEFMLSVDLEVFNHHGRSRRYF